MLANSWQRPHLSSKDNDSEDILPFAWESDQLTRCRLSSGAESSNTSLSHSELSQRLGGFRSLLHPDVGLSTNSIAAGCLKRLHRMPVFPDLSDWEDEDYFQLALDFVCAYISHIKAPKLLEDEAAVKALTHEQVYELVGSMMWMMVLNSECPSRQQPKVVGMLIDVGTFQTKDVLQNLR